MMKIEYYCVVILLVCLSCCGTSDPGSATPQNNKISKILPSENPPQRFLNSGFWVEGAATLLGPYGPIRVFQESLNGDTSWEKLETANGWILRQDFTDQVTGNSHEYAYVFEERERVPGVKVTVIFLDRVVGNGKDLQPMRVVQEILSRTPGLVMSPEIGLEDTGAPPPSAPKVELVASAEQLRPGKEVILEGYVETCHDDAGTSYCIKLSKQDYRIQICYFFEVEEKPGLKEKLDPLVDSNRLVRIRGTISDDDMEFLDFKKEIVVE